MLLEMGNTTQKKHASGFVTAGSGSTRPKLSADRDPSQTFPFPGKAWLPYPAIFGGTQGEALKHHINLCFYIRRIFIVLY
ncbi:hypothetical protein [Gluconacetobacter tumulisoli]|uniref:Uncharacterized protein n=1 Tax=Gluconacetobacter tumulisoli TaxID=1286189 RepID=A0A7W4K9F7_9PROT|nr:hypothetical protein [Gluconacetobacter tumulisoli]MBB2202816.1 hypothetical protein [Gluconacetobacter tumulisoli]